jgi:type II secretory pathway component GspD/PulD (secretin)
VRRASGILVLLLLLPLAAGAQEVPTGVRIHNDRTVTVSLEAADLRAVVNALARTSDINLVGSDKLQGRVTLNLRNVPAVHALDVILKNNGFVLIKKDDRIYEVMTPADAAQIHETVPVDELRVFQLKFADVDEVATRLVPGALPDSKHVKTDPATNKLILRANAQQIADVEQIIKELDVARPQVSIQARIVEIMVDRAKSRGVTLRMRDDTNNSVTGAGTAETIFDLAQGTSAIPTFGLTFTSERIDAAINALVRSDVAEVLSAPQISTGHAREAEFKVVNQVPYITRTTRVVDNVTVTDETITFKETGLRLKVTPRVLAGGKIQMVVEPAVLELTGFTDTSPPAPIIDERTAKTDVTITDGRWLVIGGLMRHNEQTVERGIPLLKDIPVLGWLFRSEQVTREKSNLVILVSATVLDDARARAGVDQVRQQVHDHRTKHGLVGPPLLDDADSQTRATPTGNREKGTSSDEEE